MNNMTTLADMRNFVRIVETGSITAAADSQEKVKSAVSKRLSDLEKALGVELIRRSTRKLHLTETGRSYYQRCVVDIIQENIDLAIRIGELQNSSLIAKRLFPIHQAVCASNDYLQRYGEPKTPQELSNHKCLVFSDTTEPTIWKYRTPDKKNMNVEVAPVMLSDNGNFLLDAACAGIGINKTPTFIAHKAIEKGSLRPILND